MDAREQRFYENATLNRLAIIGWTIEVAIILVAYLVEVIKGARTLPYYLIVLLAGAIPLILGWILYKRANDDIKIRYYAVIGFLVLYSYVLITGSTLMTFVYFIPLLQVLIGYSDVNLLKIYTVVCIIANIISIAIKIVYFKMPFSEYGADYEIVILGTALVLIFACVAANTSKKINDMKMGIIVAHQEKSQEILDTVTDVTSMLSQRVADIDRQSHMINDKSTTAQASVEEISQGTAEVARTISEQLEMSNDISEALTELTDISADIKAKFEGMVVLASDGMKSVDILSKSADEVSMSRENASEATQALMNSIKEAREILSLINSITSQTNLLSLNASIEAARAGEAGRGFAVVAGEISSLSQDTANATAKISQILDMLSVQANNVNRAVDGLSEISDNQTRLIADTDEKFRNINSNITEVEQEIVRQADCIETINNDNSKIAGSISNTSAFTEELSASSETTLNMTKDSLNGTLNMGQSISDVLDEVTKLSALTNKE